ncbi:MAG: sulfite oxidase [Gemmatimonas sp.]|uniref:sulfite oxidase n=1 Tax=Gemmatimonas sp. TaxID=1962908 RepID=UPI00391F7B73|nr:sulfite oxidase [Gemmatimonadota bacterium]
MSLSADHPDAPLVVVRPHPLCAETPPAALRPAITPAASVYVRSNFPTPVLDDAHQVAVRGAVRAPFAIGVNELAAMPQRTVVATVECAGNWRLGMDPVPIGEPWRYGAVSTAVWTGVPLQRLLERAGVAADAVEVLAVGADTGPRDDAEGVVTFARALPLPVALHPDTLVVTHMGGAPLTPHHGAPVRLLVPGWYGMANVKWLAALELRTVPFTGYFQRQRYVYDTADGVTPVAEARVKSMITSLVDGGRCEARVIVRGWAWSGAGAITRVELSVNGEAWREAQLGPAMSAYAWTPFELALMLPAGVVSLRSRATDAAGDTQPERIEWNRLGYGNNAVRAMTVRVG